MFKSACFSSLLLLSALVIAGCGGRPDIDTGDVDDSVVHTEAQMEEMAAQNASDMRSQ